MEPLALFEMLEEHLGSVSCFDEAVSFSFISQTDALPNKPLIGLTCKVPCLSYPKIL